MRWYYFIRNGDRLVMAKHYQIPVRPEDANPDNGDPLTPWYETKAHFDENHVHVRASCDEEATKIAMGLVRGSTNEHSC